MICDGCMNREAGLENYPCAICVRGEAFGSHIDFFKPLKEGELGNAMHEDNVQHPAHYTSGSIECIDAMTETQGVEAVKNFCICNAFKCLWRHGKKNGVEDVKKAAWYLNKFIELEEKKNED